MPLDGPIAQLGERFNGIEEVKGSSPFRSISTIVPFTPLFLFSPMSYNHLHGIITSSGFIFHSAFRVGSSRKVIVVADQKRNAPDNVGTRLRELWEEIERMINPQPKRERVPVPVPVHVPRPTRRDPYRR
jgi:hypothetical protein